jgi:hypothetical protein
LIGWGSVARADQPQACHPAQFVLWTDIARDRSSTDTTPPAMPQLSSVQLLSDEREHMEVVSMFGKFDPDTVKVRLTTSGGYSLVTTPNELHLCTDSLVLREQEHVTVVAYDQAGNASAPFESDVKVITRAREMYEHHRHGHRGSGILLLTGSIFIAGLLLLGLISYGFGRKRAPSSVAGEFLSPILAENVARAVARGYVIKLAIAMTVIMGLLMLHHPYIAIIAAPYAFMWLIELFLTRLVIGQFDRRIQRLERREMWIFINSSKLYAPLRIWDKASALPSAGLAKRD